MKRIILTIFFFISATIVMSAQYARPVPVVTDEGSAAIPTYLSYSPSSAIAADNILTSANMDDSQALQRKGRNLLLTGGALSLTGIALYASSWTMVSDSSNIGSYFSIGGIAVFAAAIPFYITGTSYCIKGKKAALNISPGTLAVVF